MILNLTPEQKEEVVQSFHKVVMEMILKYDSPETLYLMARALFITAIMKAEKDFYGYLTMQNALNDTAQELIALELGEPVTEEDKIFSFIHLNKDDDTKIH